MFASRTAFTPALRLSSAQSLRVSVRVPVQLRATRTVVVVNNTSSSRRLRTFNSLEPVPISSSCQVHLRSYATMTTPSGMSPPSGTLSAAIAEDHQEMYEYYDAYKAARDKNDLDAAERWARQLIWEVARHAVGEEIVVYPLMEKHMGEEGTRLADEDRSDHQFVKERLAKIDALEIDSPDYDPWLTEVMSHLHKHNDNEEKRDLPQLEPLIGEEGSQKAAKSFSLTKKFVPTRPHPSAPNQPPLETFAGFLAAPIDKLKDMFAKFPTEEMKEQVKS